MKTTHNQALQRTALKHWAAPELERQATEIVNAIVAIHPYKYEGLWVFDDAAVGLRQEPFVSGADVIIDRLVADIPHAQRGFTLFFSAHPFPGYQAEFDWRRAESGGNWYYSGALNLEGWLCPALLKYFDSPPAKLYAQAKAKAA